MRYAAGALDLDTTPLWGSDTELRDDLWRAENPGASAMRGLLWALPISIGDVGAAARCGSSASGLSVLWRQLGAALAPSGRMSG